VVRIVAVLGLAVVAWALLTQAPAVVHGHWAYAVLLLLTVLGALWALWLHRRARPLPGGWRRVGSIALLVGAVGGLAMVAYFRPFSAQEPALAAMASDGAVRVTETRTRIVLEPTGTRSSTGVLFQPGARVEARAYAAVLRPLAEAGHTVVIVQQPLGIAFLATGALDDARAARPDVTGWVIGGHSLGGTVAAIGAEEADDAATARATGLLLYASYPATDMADSLRARVLSISGTNDGLATPADIEASRADLPDDARFQAIEGAVHAHFGDYGAQRGDGEPTISHDEARTQISNASVQFVAELAAGTPAAP
jgi:pimeloyl-ACP methyl ester carboxylesterase